MGWLSFLTIFEFATQFMIQLISVGGEGQVQITVIILRNQCDMRVLYVVPISYCLGLGLNPSVRCCGLTLKGALQSIRIYSRYYCKLFIMVQLSL